MLKQVLLSGLFLGTLFLTTACGDTEFQYACQCQANGANTPVILACASDDDAEKAVSEGVTSCQANNPGATCVCACVKNNTEC